MTTGLEINLDTDGEIAVLKLYGEARVENATRIESVITDALQSGAKHALLDFTNLGFMDSASAGVLLRSEELVKSHDGRLVIFGVRRVVKRMFDASGLNTCFTVAEDENAARSLVM